MAVLTKSQLETLSNNTYTTNGAGSITAADVRNFNTDFISSSIVVSQTGSMAVGFATNATSASYAVTASYALNAGASVNTGSLLVTASAALNVITFTKGDASTFDITISASGSAPAGTVSSSAQIQAYGIFAELGGDNLISSSAQITSFGFVSGSYETTGRGIVSSSAQIAQYGYATTGSNTFNGNQSITGSLSISGSVNTSVYVLSIVSSTASIDGSKGNSFVLNLPSGSNTRLETSNLKVGQTINLLVSQSASPGTLTLANNLLEASGSEYSASQVASAQDLITLATFADPNVVYVANILNLR